MDAPEAGQSGLESGFSSTKKENLEVLKREGNVSLIDLAQRLRISKMAVLKHLAILEGKGLVERSFRPGGRGRPRAYFALTRRASHLFPEAYTDLSLRALAFIEQRLGRESVVRFLELRSQAVYAANGRHFEDLAFPDKVRELAAFRDEGGYMADASRVGAKNGEVLEHNCPIYAIAEKYPEACQVEVGLFRKLLHEDVEATHRVVAGAPVCRFLIRRRDEFHA